MTTKIKIAVITATIVILTGIIALLVGCHRSRQVANTPTTEENSCEYNSENNTDNTTAGNTEESTTKADQPTTEPTEEDSQPSTEESSEEVTTKEPATNPQEPTTTKAPETTAPTVAPTNPPTAAPTVAPTQEPTTEAVKVHGKDGVILDTLYFQFTSGVWQVSETAEEYIAYMEGKGKVAVDTTRGLSKIGIGKAGYADFLGVGLILCESTEADVKEYFGNPYYLHQATDGSHALFYYYKDSGLLIYFAILDSDNSLYSIYVGLREHFDYVTDEHLYKE